MRRLLPVREASQWDKYNGVREKTVDIDIDSSLLDNIVVDPKLICKRWFINDAIERCMQRNGASRQQKLAAICYTELMVNYYYNPSGYSLITDKYMDMLFDRIIIALYILLDVIYDATLHNSSIMMHDGSVISPMEYSPTRRYYITIGGKLSKVEDKKWIKRIHQLTSKTWKP